MKTNSSPVLALSVFEPFIGERATRYLQAYIEFLPKLYFALIFTVGAAALIGWIVGTRQYGLLEWLIALSFLLLLLGFISLAHSSLRLRSLRQRHRDADIRGAFDLVVLSRIEALHLRGASFALAGVLGLVFGGVALAFLGTAISAALVAALWFVGGVLVMASLQRWDRQGFAVTAFVVSAVSSPPSAREAFARMTPAGEQRQAMLQVYAADESLRAGREVLAIAQDDRAYWPSLDDLPGHSFMARVVLRCRTLAVLKWQIASAAFIALILAALVDFPFWPLLPGPTAAFSALVNTVPGLETAEDEAEPDDTQAEAGQTRASQDKEQSVRESRGDDQSGSDSQEGGDQGDGTSPDGDTGGSGQSDGADSGGGHQSDDRDSNSSDGGKGDAGTNPSQDTAPDERDTGESQSAQDGDQPHDRSDNASESDSDGANDGESQGESGAGDPSETGDDGSETSDGEDGGEPAEADAGQGDEPGDQSGENASEAEDSVSDASGPKETSSDQSGSGVGAPLDQAGQEASEAPAESEGSSDQGLASGATGGEGGAPSTNAEGGPSEVGEPAPEPSETKGDPVTEDAAPSGVQPNEPGTSGAGSPDQETDGTSGAGDGSGAPGDPSEPIPSKSAGGASAGGEDLGLDGASEGDADGGAGVAMDTVQGVDPTGGPGSLGEQSGLGELVETDTPQDDFPLVEGVRVLAPDGEVGVSADLEHGTVVSLANPGGLAEAVEASPMTRTLSEEDLYGLEFPPPKQSLPAWISDLMQPQE